MRDFIPFELRKFIPLIAFGMATFYAMSAAMVMRAPIAAVTNSKADEPAAAKPAASRGTPTAEGLRAAEPVHKSVIRMLSDLDDILDTIHDAKSFEAAKPKMLRRAREQAALAALHPNAGMTPLGHLARHEMQQAVNRHAKSLARAIEAVPGLDKWFNDELGKALSP